MPALLISTSTLPNRDFAKLIAFLTCAKSATSVFRARAVPPLELISSAMRSISNSERAQSKTLALWAANLRAVASPIPRLAPVMITDLPLMVLASSISVPTACGFQRANVELQHTTA